MKLHIIREKDEIDVLLLPHKSDGMYSYVNLTKGHICPCKFNSIETALADLNRYSNIITYSIIKE